MIDVSVFEVLVLIGLVLLVLALGITAFVVVRRPRKSPGPPTSSLTTPLQLGEGEAQPVGSGQQTAGVADDRLSDDLNSRATALMASAEHTRAEAEEEARARRAEMREQRADLERREQRLSDREERLDSDVRALEERTRQLDELKGDLKAQRKKLADAASQHQAALERVAGLTAEQAKAELIAAVEHDAKLQAVLVARDIERQAVRDAEGRAQMIVVGAIQRIASEQTSESVVSAVHLPGDDMKGRIIGREGRNIRAFEQVTGVNVMIDDTP